MPGAAGLSITPSCGAQIPEATAEATGLLTALVGEDGGAPDGAILQTSST